MSRPNVLVIVMDSVRARNTSLHGHRHDTTPNLAALAQDATTYEQARAPAQWSLPSHVSMFTGLHVGEHGITSDDDALKPGETVFDELADRGYETGVFSENPYLTLLDTGLKSGFDTIEGGSQETLFEGTDPNEFKGDLSGFLRESLHSGRPVRSLINGTVAKMAWDYPKLLPAGLQRQLRSGVTPGSTYTDLFQDWVAGRSGPWAACINYMDAHHPYDPLPEHDLWDDGSIDDVQSSVSAIPMGFYLEDDPWWKCEVLENLYDGAIRQVDHEVGQLLDILDNLGELDDTLLIITSDHGEGFGERSPVREVNLAGHNVGSHEVNLHVPLVVKYPGQSEGDKVSSPVVLTALKNEILSALNGEHQQFGTHQTLSRTQGLKKVQLDQLREIGIDTRPFEGHVDILYEERDDSLRKHLRWNGKVVTENCVNAQMSYRIDENQPNCLRAAVNALEPADVTASGNYDATEATKSRLKELGYR